MKERAGPKGKKLLLMGSSAFDAKELPVKVKVRIDRAIARNVKIVVGEALGSNRLYQDYLKSKGYKKVVVGHAMRLRYNAGNWDTMQYGKDLKERERRMIEDCDSAIVIWVNKSSVISENLEPLKRLGEPTYLYEYLSETNTPEAADLDPRRTYDPYYHAKEYWRKRKSTR